MFLSLLLAAPCFTLLVNFYPTQSDTTQAITETFHGLYFVNLCVWHPSRKIFMREVCYRGQYLKIHILACLPHPFFCLLHGPILFQFYQLFRYRICIGIRYKTSDNLQQIPFFCMSLIIWLRLLFVYGIATLECFELQIMLAYTI